MPHYTIRHDGWAAQIVNFAQPPQTQGAGQRRIEFPSGWSGIRKLTRGAIAPGACRHMAAESANGGNDRSGLRTTSRLSDASVPDSNLTGNGMSGICIRGEPEVQISEAEIRSG